MTAPARRLLPAVLAVAAAGLTLGFWGWLVRLPTARVLVPGGEVAYVHGPPALPLALALILGLAAVAAPWLLASRLGGVPLGRSAFCYLPLLLLLVDGARLLLPLGRLTDPFVILTYEGRWIVAAAAVLAVVVLHVRLLGRPTWRPRPGAMAVETLVVVFLVYLACLPRAIRVGPTGDEPDYLLVAHSLLLDRDFDLQNNRDARDYLRFVPRVELHAYPGPRGGLYDQHRLGLPAVIAPAYAVGLLTGAPVRLSVVVFLCLVAAVVAARTVDWAHRLTGHVPGAVLAALTVAIAAPGFFYAYAIYPEPVVALVLLEVVRRLGEPARRSPWVVGVLVASLPWFHEKFLVLTVVLAGLTFYVYRTLTPLLVPLALSALGQAAYYLVLYGRPMPFGAYPLLPPLAAIPNGLVGLWLDRDHGLLTLAPVYLLGAVGLPAFFREHRRTAWIALLAFLSLYGVVGSYREWWGGFAPAPRYLVPLLPLLALPVAFGARALLAAARPIRVLALACLSALVAGYAVVFPALQYRHAHPFRTLFPGIDWTRYLPSWVSPDERTLPLTALALAAAGSWVFGRWPAAFPALAPGVRLTLAGSLSLMVVAGVVLVGDLVSGAGRPHLTQEQANQELRRVLGRPLSVRSAGPLPPEPLRLVYEAERLPGQAQRTVEDPLAENGLARLGRGPDGHLVFGPYETLPRGAYRARFRLRAGEPGAGALVGITAARGQVVVASRDIAPDELSADAYREVTIDFTLAARTRDLEWRVATRGPGALLVDRIAIVPLGLAP